MFPIGQEQTSNQQQKIIDKLKQRFHSAGENQGCSQHSLCWILQIMSLEIFLRELSSTFLGLRGT